MKRRKNKTKNLKRCATLIILVTTFLVYQTAYAEIKEDLYKIGGGLKSSITGFAANVKTNGIGTAIKTSPRIAGAYKSVTSALPSGGAIVGALKSVPGKAWSMVPILGAPSAGATPQQDNSPVGQLKRGEPVTITKTNTGTKSGSNGPACKDCHKNRAPVDTTKVKQYIGVGVNTPTVNAQPSTEAAVAPNPNDINPASAKAPIGQYHNDGTRVGDRSIRDLKYAVVPKTGESADAFTKAKASYDKFYGNAPQALPASAEVKSGSTLRSTVMKNSQGNAVYQNWQGISQTTTSITGADNKAVTYEAHAKSMVDNIKSSINSGSVTAVVNGASVAIKSFVFSSRANNFDEGTNGVITQEGKFVPARLITAITNNGKTTYEFTPTKNIGDSLKDIKGTTFRNGAFSVDIK